ncbi:hypothetical protein FB567DRAFT_592603 [Paraphoma chrysanthemicola]|uniref:NACHT domain-containing protein n=1 Tax=Paraphoma chrysanthemicola TaxID=798071 RepID=A0A8K0R3B5_9PLEO|nr:hypothetical protein FB567DRAFT_592603 [Paraphoma chrysanthemicola]
MPFMAQSAVPQQNANDLWAEAAAQISEEARRNINFSRDDKLQLLEELHAEAEISKQKSLERRWKFKRTSGEMVILRDVFAKIVRWIETFKQIGDVAIQYDPGHASLPWAAVRFVLQLAVNDVHKYGSLIEGLAEVAELICRYRATESLYLRSSSPHTKELEKHIVKLYAKILLYLSNAKTYFEQAKIKRVMKSIDLGEANSLLEAVLTAESDIKSWMTLVDCSESNREAAELRSLLRAMDAPMYRMDGKLNKIADNLEGARAKILRWLSCEPYEDHHIVSKREVLKGTGEWLLNDSTFKQWKNGSASSILWLNGIAGSGKSKLVSTVIDDAEQAFHEGRISRPIYFYCSRNPAEPSRSDPRAILASLAKQLSCGPNGKTLQQHAIKIYEEKESKYFASNELHIDESCQLLEDLTNEALQTTIIIDALDECNPTTRQLLIDALERVLKKSSSLVKIFISCRKDHDLVPRLESYPGLEISSQKNGEDIAKFVKEEIERLVSKKQLLRHSEDKSVMKGLIEKKVIEGAGEMFRWASMQLQNLCLSLDADIKEKLSRSPPQLDEFYEQMYNKLSTVGDGHRGMLFKNILRWLLCGQRSLKTTEFIKVVAVVSEKEQKVGLVSTNLVVDICHNFVVLDPQLDTFRFAHLSVREFLEQRPEYTPQDIHCFAARVCLSVVTVPCSKIDATSQDLHSAVEMPITFAEYADTYWAKHCQLAESGRSSGYLKLALERFLSQSDQMNSYARSWIERLSGYSSRDLWSSSQNSWMKLLTRVLQECRWPKTSVALLLCCLFDFEEPLQDIIGLEVEVYTFINTVVGWVTDLIRSPLQGEYHGRYRHQYLLRTSAEFGSRGVFASLIWRPGIMPKIPKEITEIAVRCYVPGTEVLSLLLNQWRVEVPITLDILCAALRCKYYQPVLVLLLDSQKTKFEITREVVDVVTKSPIPEGALTVLLSHSNTTVQDVHSTFIVLIEKFSRKIIALFHDIHQTHVLLTEEVLKAAVVRGSHADEILLHLLDRQEPDISITTGMLKLAAAHPRCGEEVIELMFNRHGIDVAVTQAVMIAAASNERCGDKLVALFLDKHDGSITITKDVLQAAAENNNCGDRVISLLLKCHGVSTMITEDVLQAAARNQFSGLGITEILLDHHGAVDAITEKVLRAAAENIEQGPLIMRALLSRLTVSSMITEETLEAAAENKMHAIEIVSMLLEVLEAHVQLTEDAVAAVLHNCQHQNAATVIISRLRDDFRISTKIVEAAVTNEHCSREMMCLLLDWREEDVLNAASPKSWMDSGYVERLGPRLLRFRLKKGWLYHKVTKDFDLTIYHQKGEYDSG